MSKKLVVAAQLECFEHMFTCIFRTHLKLTFDLNAAELSTTPKDRFIFIRLYSLFVLTINLFPMLHSVQFHINIELKTHTIADALRATQHFHSSFSGNGTSDAQCLGTLVEHLASDLLQ